MSTILLIDTSVLLNVLNVPGRNQHHEKVMGQFEAHLKASATLLLPLGAVIETGNHIAHIADGRQRRRYAEIFVREVKAAVEGNAPWKTMHAPDAAEVAGWIESFPEAAMRGQGIADLSIVKAWERTCEQFPRFRVMVWSLDQHLLSYDHDGRPRR